MNSHRMQDLRDLINHRSDGPVLSVFCRTDPREPSNKGDSPAWGIALKNGLRAVAEATGEDRALHGEAQRLGTLAERRLAATPAAERGRSVALFLGADGNLDRLITFQIPVREDRVALDSGPVVWPLIDVLDRGLRTGLVLVSHDRIRMLEWQDGTAHDLEASDWDLELGDWREYRAATRANPHRGRQSVTHDAAFDDRVEEWRAKFVKGAAKAIAESSRELQFDRLVVAAEGSGPAEFTAALPEDVRNLVEATVPSNLIDLSAAEAAARLDPHLRDAWRTRVNGVAEQAVARIGGGDRAAAGADQILLALVEGRVEHLVLDPYLEFGQDGLSDGARQAIADAGEATAPEALVELAIRTDARISSAAVSEVPALDRAGGVLALLRY